MDDVIPIIISFLPFKARRILSRRYAAPAKLMDYSENGLIAMVMMSEHHSDIFGIARSAHSSGMTGEVLEYSVDVYGLSCTLEFRQDYAGILFALFGDNTSRVLFRPYYVLFGRRSLGWN